MREYFIDVFDGSWIDGYLLLEGVVVFLGLLLILQPIRQVGDDAYPAWI